MEKINPKSGIGHNRTLTQIQHEIQSKSRINYQILVITDLYQGLVDRFHTEPVDRNIIPTFSHLVRIFYLLKRNKLHESWR